MIYITPLAIGLLYFIYCIITAKDINDIEVTYTEVKTK